MEKKKTYQTIQWTYCGFTRHYGGYTSYKSSLLPWDVGAAAVYSISQTLELQAQEEQVTCSQRHIAGKWQGQGCTASWP